MIEKIDQFEEQNKKENEESNKQTEIQTAGAQMRLEHLHRVETPQRSVQQNEIVGDIAEPIVSTSSSIRKHLFDQSDEEEMVMFFLHAQRREQRKQKGD